MTVFSLHIRVLVAALSGAALIVPYGVAHAAQLQNADTGSAVAGKSQGRINRVAFEGNKKVEKDQLTFVVESQANRMANPATIKADEERIRTLYQRAGRANAQVGSRLVPLPNGTVDVVFSISEGDKTGVKEIRFVGNHAFSASRLRDLMATSEMNFLSFLKTSDVYDPERVNSDLELIRRYYLKSGYADFQILASEAAFDPAGGCILTITVEEGEQYRVGSVGINSRVPAVSSESLRGRISTAPGSVYSADAVERSVQTLTADFARQGSPFFQVRPIGTRDPSSKTVNLDYVIEESPHVYIERVNVRGNTRTRDYFIRREFELGEGDAYNQVLIDRAERRLNNLGYFKTVRISQEPGSTADRVVLNVDVEDQSTGSFAISGGYSTSDGLISEVSVTENNFLGRGQFVRIAGSLGENSEGVDFSFTEPYFLGHRLSAGIDLFSKNSEATSSTRYELRKTGGQLRLGLPITEEFSITARYSLYESKVSVPNDSDEPYNDCSVAVDGVTTLNADGTPNKTSCQGNGEASIAIKQAVGSSITSLVGLTLNYNTLDNTRNPRNGFNLEVKPEIAGLGGDSKFYRVTGDARYYKELHEDVVGILHLQGGHVGSLTGDNLRLTDQFFLGPSLVRGFAVNGIGPRDVSSSDSNALGGTTYAGVSGEIQFPIPGLPREIGLKGAVFADAGTLFGYKAGTTFDVNNDSIINGYDPVSSSCVGSDTVASECVSVRDGNKIRSSVGVGLLWNSPLGPIRFDYAIALTKDSGDETQAFRFSGGTRF
jgi:outer membrane protein insertion porin family